MVFYLPPRSQAFLLSVSDSTVPLRRLQIPELRGGAVPRAGHPLYAHLRASTV